MNMNKHKMFLLLSIIFLLISLSTINATENLEKHNSTDLTTSTETTTETQDSNDYSTNLQNNKNKTIFKHETTDNKSNQDKKDTLLELKFLTDNDDEFSTENYLFTHIDEEYTIDLTLKEIQNNTPVNGIIQLHHSEYETPLEIQLDSTGHYQQTFIINSIGSSEIYAYFPGDDNYNSQRSDTIEIESEQYETTLTLNTIDNVPLNSTINVSGKLYYDENKPIENAQIIVSINNQIIANPLTNGNGEYSLNYSTRGYDIQEMLKLTVEYHSNTDKYGDSNNETNFDIEKLENHIELYPIEQAVVGTPQSISGTVYDDNNNRYSGLMRIIIKDKNSQELYVNDTVNVDDSSFQYTYIPLKSKINEIVLIIDENDLYTNTYKIENFEVEPATLILQYSDIYESLVKDNVSIGGTITNENDNPLPNITISIFTDLNELGSCVTDENGEFLFTEYIFDEIDDDDFFDIYFMVEETQDHDYIFEQSCYYLSRRNTNVILNGNDSIKINQQIILNGKVEDAYNNSMIPQGSIMIKINGHEVKNNVTIDSQGNFNTFIPITEDYAGNDELSIEAFFVPMNSNVYYEDNFDSIVTIIESTGTNLTLESTDTLVNNEVDISINLIDQYGNKLNKTVSLTIRTNNSTIYNEDITLENGQKSIKFTPLTEGIYHIYAEYAGLNNIYGSSYDEYDISVEKIPTKLYSNELSNISYVNKTLTIEGVLTDNRDMPLKNTNITVEVMGNNTSIIRNLTTNADGNYSMSFVPLIQDNLTVRVSYAGNNTYNENYTQQKINIVKYNTTLDMDSLPEIIKYADNIIIQGQVLENNNTIVNGTVTLKINNQEIYNINLDNGHFRYEYTIKEIGQDNILQVIFNENEVFTSSEKNVVFNVEALTTRILINSIDNTTINNKITINGTLKDEKNNNLDANLSVSIDNEILNKTVAVNNGIFSFDYTPVKAGLLLVNFTYNGDNLKYESTYNFTTVNVKKSIISIDNIESIINNEDFTVTIKGNVTNPDNLNNSNIKVIVKINDTEYETFTDENGTFVVTSDKLIPSEYNITLNINETDFFDSYEKTLNPIVISKDTPIITINQINNVTYDAPINITGIVTDSYNNPLANINIIIQLDNSTYYTSTDSEGNFIQTTNDFQAGLNNITITTNETDYYNQASKDLTFEANRQEATITLYENGRIIPGESFAICGQLKDKTGKSITNKSITVNVNNKKYYVLTDDNGEFNLSIKNAKLGEYRINVTFNDTNYVPASVNKTITVSKVKVNISVHEIISVVGENITLKATLMDEFGEVVDGGNLVFKINGRTLRMDDRFDTNTKESHKFTVRNGVVEYVITAEAYLKNAVNISATYSGSFKYESVKSDISLVSIKLREAIIDIQTNATMLKHHENITFTANIEDITQNTSINNIIINNSTVIFKLNGITLKDENNKTIEVKVINNLASYTYNVGAMASVDKDNCLRDYNVTAVLINPNYYPDIKNTTTFHIEKSSTDIRVDSVVLKGSTLNIQANILDYMGQNVQGYNKICVKINGVSYKEENITKYYNVTNGIINITDINVGDNKVKSIEIVTGERQAYLPSRVTIDEIVVEE